MGRKRSRWVLGMAAALWFAALAAPAHAAVVDDPDLAKGPLDLKRLIATKHDATAPLRLTLVTYGSWRASVLDVSGRNRLFFLFNTDRSGGADYIGEISFRDGRLRMRLADADGDVFRTIRVSHPRLDRVRVTVPRGLPNPDGNVWLAGAEHWKTATGRCATICEDRIPSGRGWLKVTPGQ